MKEIESEKEKNNDLLSKETYKWGEKINIYL